MARRDCWRSAATAVLEKARQPLVGLRGQGASAQTCAFGQQTIGNDSYREQVRRSELREYLAVRSVWIAD
jgi:hypothetical protein